MSFQWIFDYAETIAVDTKPMIATTTARDGTIRSVARGGQPWKFDVKLPDGMPWTQLRSLIASAQRLDRTTAANVQINDPGHIWINQYLGNSQNITDFRADITNGSNIITLVQSPTTTNGYKFRAGDIIQMANGHVYNIVSDVLYNSNQVQLHRPVIDNTQSAVVLKVGPNCFWNVLCVEFPNWILTARNQVSWEGSFKFIENLV